MNVEPHDVIQIITDEDQVTRPEIITVLKTSVKLDLRKFVNLRVLIITLSYGTVKVPRIPSLEYIESNCKIELSPLPELEYLSVTSSKIHLEWFPSLKTLILDKCLIAQSGCPFSNSSSALTSTPRTPRLKIRRCEMRDMVTSTADLNKINPKELFLDLVVVDTTLQLTGPELVNLHGVYGTKDFAFPCASDVHVSDCAINMMIIPRAKNITSTNNTNANKDLLTTGNILEFLPMDHTNVTVNRITKPSIISKLDITSDQLEYLQPSYDHLIMSKIPQRIKIADVKVIEITMSVVYSITLVKTTTLVLARCDLTNANIIAPNLEKVILVNNTGVTDITKKIVCRNPYEVVP